MKWRWEDFMGFDPRMRPAYTKLRDHPRCVVFSGDEADTSEVIAASQLVISACFTSPTIEALGGRGRGIFYDATGKFRGCYPDAFPMMVAHDYQDLKKYAYYWLYQNSDEDFQKYLAEHIEHEVDSYADGGAVTRFRKKLCI
jgi:hypothetical protein